MFPFLIFRQTFTTLPKLLFLALQCCFFTVSDATGDIEQVEDHRIILKDMPLLQDGPPRVRYARRISNTRRRAMAMFFAVSGASAWGMYQVGQGNKIRSLIIARFEEYAWLYFFIVAFVILGGLFPEAEKKPDPRLIEIINVLKKRDPYGLAKATLMAILHKPDEPETDVLYSAMMEGLQNGNKSSRPS